MTVTATSFPALSYADTDRVFIGADWTVYVDGEQVVVPAGFVSDGASIPASLRPLCGHPLRLPRVYAAILHDHLYTTHQLSRATADAAYRAFLIDLGIPRSHAYIEWACVRMFGWRHWD